MARGIWNPPHWLVVYGHACAAAFGIPTEIPPYPTGTGDEWHRLAEVDLDQELIRLLAEENR